MADREVLVLLACDTDQDRESFGGCSDAKREECSWRGVGEGIPLFNDRFRGMTDPYGGPLRVLWFIRSDEQMEEMGGDPAWPFRKFSKRLSELESFGDEIGWHVHLWRWNDAVGGWYAEVDDRPWIEKCIRKGYSAIPERWRPTSVKSGWGFQTYRTLALLGELGLKVDLSCIPDAHNISYTKQGLKVDVQDWRGSPTLPYLPHKKDHKKAGGEEALSIWEVPNATFRYKNLNVAGRFVRNMIPYRGGKLVSPRIVVKKRGSAAAGGSIELFRRACDEVFSSAGKGGISVFSIYFHPDCLLVDSSSGLYENRDNLAANLECIGTVSKRTGVPFRFLTGKELVAKLGATE